MPPASPVPGWSSGEVCRLIIARRLMRSTWSLPSTVQPTRTAEGPQGFPGAPDPPYDGPLSARATQQSGRSSGPRGARHREASRTARTSAASGASTARAASRRRPRRPGRPPRRSWWRCRSGADPRGPTRPAAGRPRPRAREARSRWCSPARHRPRPGPRPPAARRGSRDLRRQLPRHPPRGGRPSRGRRRVRRGGRACTDPCTPTPGESAGARQVSLPLPTRPHHGRIRPPRHNRPMSTSRIAVVTGASRGIGAATARALAADGFHVVCAARRRDRIEALAEEIGGRAVACDVTDAESVAGLAREVGGTLHVLVNNAGGAFGSDPVESADPDQWRAMYEVNVLGLLRVTQALLPALRAGGDGLVVNMGSTAGRIAYEG